MVTHTVLDTTKDRKTADNLLIEFENVYADLEAHETWAASVGGLVTDASGESRKARRLFLNRHPHVIVLDCWSHQAS